jgi:Dor1-like family
MTDPSTPRGHKSTADFLTDGYLANLLSYSLEALNREPGTLKSQEEALEQELQDTATKDYQGFIDAASCFHQIRGQVQDVKEQLEELAEALHSLQTQTSDFTGTAQKYQVLVVSRRGCCIFTTNLECALALDRLRVCGLANASSTYCWHQIVVYESCRSTPPHCLYCAGQTSAASSAASTAFGRCRAARDPSAHRHLHPDK